MDNVPCICVRVPQKENKGCDVRTQIKEYKQCQYQLFIHQNNCVYEILNYSSLPFQLFLDCCQPNPFPLFIFIHQFKMNKEKLIGFIIKKETYKQTKVVQADILKKKQQAVNVSIAAIHQILKDGFNTQAKLFAARFLKDCFQKGNAQFIEKVQSKILPILVKIVNDSQVDDQVLKYGGSYTKATDLEKFKSVVMSLFTICRQCIYVWAACITDNKRGFAQAQKSIERLGNNPWKQGFTYFKEENFNSLIQNCQKGGVQVNPRANAKIFGKQSQNQSDRQSEVMQEEKEVNGKGGKAYKSVVKMQSLLKKNRTDLANSKFYTEKQLRELDKKWNEAVNEYIEEAVEFDQNFLQRQIQEYDKCINFHKSKQNKQKVRKEVDQGQKDEGDRKKVDQQQQIRKADLESEKKKKELEQQRKKEDDEKKKKQQERKKKDQQEQKQKKIQQQKQKQIQEKRHIEEERKRLQQERLRQQEQKRQRQLQSQRKRKLKQQKQMQSQEQRKREVQEEKKRKLQERQRQLEEEQKRKRLEQERKEQRKEEARKIEGSKLKEGESKRRGEGLQIQQTVKNQKESSIKIPFSPTENLKLKIPNIPDIAMNSKLSSQMQERVNFEQSPSESEEGQGENIQKTGKFIEPPLQKISVTKNNQSRERNSDKNPVPNQRQIDQLKQITLKYEAQRNYLCSKIEKLQTEMREMKKRESLIKVQYSQSLGSKELQFLKARLLKEQKEKELMQNQLKLLRDEVQKMKTQFDRSKQSWRNFHESSLIPNQNQTNIRTSQNKPSALLSQADQSSFSNNINPSRITENNKSVLPIDSPSVNINIFSPRVDDEYLNNLTHYDKIGSWIDPRNQTSLKKCILRAENSQTFFQHEGLKVIIFYNLFMDNGAQFLKMSFSYHFITIQNKLPKTSFKNIPEIDLWIKPVMGEKQKYVQQTIARLCLVPFNMMKCSISFGENYGKTVTFLLPFLFYNFLHSVEFDNEQFYDIMKSKQQQTIKSKVFQLDPSIVSSPKRLQKVFKPSYLNNQYLQICFNEGTQQKVFMVQIEFLRNQKAVGRILPIPINETMVVKAKQLLSNIIFLLGSSS